MKIRTRFAPSPTGFIHIGNLRTALFSWLYAKKNNGNFLIRIDDTDVTRSEKKYTDNIFYILNWLNIKSDENIIFQSKRLPIYKKIIEKLLNEKKVYKCYCDKERLAKLKETQLAQKEKIRYDKFCKNKISSKNNFIIRMNTEQYTTISFKDEIKGEIIFNNEEIDDFIIAKNNFYPTYNFASVIDDIEYNITDIIRGDDHISNTPKQIIIFNALTNKIPKFYHLPLILDEHKKPLSKREKDSRIDYYKDNGFLPEAILNFILRLGWSNKNKEIFTLKEMIQLFDTKNITNAPSIINRSKLIWLNKYYLKNLDNRYILKHLLLIEKKFNFNTMLMPNFIKLIELNKNKVSTLHELLTKNIFLFNDKIEIEQSLLQLFFSKKIIIFLKNMYIKIKNTKLIWNIDNIKTIIIDLTEHEKILISEVAPALRILLIGQNIPNQIYEIIFLSGKILLLKKIRHIIKLYENGAIAQFG